MEIELSNLLVGGLSIVGLTIGFTEALKSNFGLEGKWAFVAALVIGVAFSLAAQVAELVPAASAWIVRVVQGLACGLAATGWYDIGKRLLKPA